VSDIIFAHNGTNRPESKTMHMFCPVRQVPRRAGLSAAAEISVVSFFTELLNLR